MSTSAPEKTQATAPEPPPAEPAVGWRPGRGAALAAVFAVWVVLGTVLDGRQTLNVARSDLSPFALWVNGIRDALGRAQDNVVVRIIGAIADGLDAVVQTLQDLLSQAPPGRPVPEIGWFGVVALAVWVVFAVAGWRMAVFAALVFGAFGTFGYWQDSIDTLIVTLVSVVIVLVFGIPLGLWMGNSRRVTAVVTPVLDVIQTLPSFVYLLPVTLFFGIGSSAAVVATVVYAFAPVVRITAQGVRAVAPGAMEAATSLGATGFQRLRGVQLPMARRTILVGVNQSIMAALSIVTIAAFINSPGLGGPIILALTRLDLGSAFTAGILIVFMAILLDRSTTAAGERTMLVRSVSAVRRWRIILLISLVAALVCVYFSRLYLGLAQFPESPDLGAPVSRAAGAVAEWARTDAAGFTQPLSTGFTRALLNPFQSLVADSPWWLTAAVLVLVPLLLAGVRAALTAVLCVAIILGVGIWNDAMVTLATALLGTVVVMALALVFGVLMATYRAVDLVVRPILDAAQTIPPFIYLIPALALFGPTRFTAMVAGIVYGAPVAIKLVCDGIRGVAPGTVEAARSVGSSRLQLIGKVQLPMARGSVALAANQGLLYVFSVIVIGGFVGAGGLGYLVVAGFSQTELFGKGMAAGIGIAALAVLIDRMTQGWAARLDPQRTSTPKEN